MHNCPARLSGFEIRLNQHGPTLELLQGVSVNAGLLRPCPSVPIGLEDEHEPAEEEDHQHERSDGQSEEGKHQVEEPENESTHVASTSLAQSTLNLNSPFATATGAVGIRRVKPFVTRVAVLPSPIRGAAIRVVIEEHVRHR